VILVDLGGQFFKGGLGRNFEPGKKLSAWEETLSLGRNFEPGQKL
jgi:hypothetical protein